MKYFTELDVVSCPKHQDTKRIFNKHWNKWSGLGDTLAGLTLTNPAEFDERRFGMVAARIGEVESELVRISSALRRCCESRITFGA